MKQLAILGASGHGKVLAEIAELCGWQPSFFDDAWPTRQVNGHWPVVGTTATLLEKLSDFDGVIVGIGNNSVRLAKSRLLSESGVALVSLVHPQAVLSPRARLGSGSVVMAGVVVNVDAVIGEGAILNTGCSVDHDCKVGSFVHLSPGARLAGGVTIGESSWIGIGASVRQLIRIGAGATIGAGAAVVKDVAEGTTVVGVPARAL
ncbi:acetyltransferase [Pseudomonas sp. MH2]|uniref:Acetyltransferase n=1 Tax=Pseudomonas machongensis TaxID=3110229 RepID=A0ABU5V935_9PSED|nr:acetyltransferase [Pseudomonas sp. MH2]MEA5669841.1 acetyltransferase [Pseudomonas sp. MH2]